MTNQQWSVLLETVSFFFVAIDLYGRERLERTHVNLMTYGEKLSSAINNLQGQKWNAERNRLLLWVLYFIAGIFAFIVGVTSGVFADTFAEGVTIGNIVTSIVIFLVFWVLWYLITLVGVALLLFLTFCILWISKTFLGGLIRTLQFTNFEGLLLVTGSLMFVVSKYLQLLV